MNENLQSELNENEAPKKRRGRLKKGEVIKASGYKPMDMATAFKSIEGMKYKIANKYRVFCNSSVSYEDLISAANIGIAWAYRDWDANTAKFTTFAHSRIERQIDLFLCDMLPRYKNNTDAKHWLRRKNGESFQQLQDAKITKDSEFNAEHELDGIKTFTKELYNLYTQKKANELFNDGNNLVITTASGFKSAHEEFDIFDVLSEQPAEDEEVNLEEEYDIESLKGEKQKIAKMIVEGYTITEIAKTFGVSKSKLIRMSGASLA